MLLKPIQECTIKSESYKFILITTVCPWSLKYMLITNEPEIFFKHIGQLHIAVTLELDA